jgi:antitoxin component YwqK of YwqJK toxin-antitoxin module
MFRRWYPDGGLAEEIPMNEGQPDGVSMAYHPGGFLKARVVLRKGEVLEKKYWDEKDRMPAPSASGGDAPGEK